MGAFEFHDLNNVNPAQHTSKGTQGSSDRHTIWPTGNENCDVQWPWNPLRDAALLQSKDSLLDRISAMAMTPLACSWAENKVTAVALTPRPRQSEKKLTLPRRPASTQWPKARASIARRPAGNSVSRPLGKSSNSGLLSTVYVASTLGAMWSVSSDVVFWGVEQLAR